MSNGTSASGYNYSTKRTEIQRIGITESGLEQLANAILETVRRPADSVTESNEISLFATDGGGFQLARWSRPHSAIRLKKYTKKYEGHGTWAIAHDVIMTALDAGIRVEVLWDE